MCGRFTLKYPVQEVLSAFGIGKTDIEYTPSYNVAPQQDIIGVVDDQGELGLEQFRWGLIPFWAKDEKIGYKMINARGETIAEKASFRTSFKSKRCLVAADGFYEWKKVGNSKVPFYFTLANRKVFGFAGLWDQWNSPDGKAIKTCTIVTTNPNPLLKQVHDRMPVIIEKKDEKKWLGQETDIDELQALIKPYPEKLMKKSQVTEFVNSVKNNSPKCIEAQQTLF